MKKGIRPTIVGCLLLLLSAPLVFLMGVEIYCEQKAQRQFSTWDVNLREAYYYVMDNGDIGIESESNAKAFITKDNGTLKYRDDLKLQDIQLSNRGTMGNFKLQLLYGNNTIQLSDTFPLRDTGKNEDVLPKLMQAPVDIHINENDFSSGKPIEFNPSDIEISRYYSYLSLLLVKDLDAKTESMLLIERLGASPQPEKSSWRFLWISKDGKVKEELFNNKERKQQSSRTYFINQSAMAGYHLEYKTRVLGGFPTYLYPLAYPLLSFLAGAVLAAYGLTRLAKKGVGRED